MTLLDGAEDFVNRLRDNLGETRFLLIEEVVRETLQEMGKDPIPEGNGCPYCFGYGMETSCFACGRVRKIVEIKPVNADFLNRSSIVDVDDSYEEE